MGLNSFGVRGMKIYTSNFNSQGNRKIEFFSQETYHLHIFGNQTTTIAGFEDIKISIVR